MRASNEEILNVIHEQNTENYDQEKLLDCLADIVYCQAVDIECCVSLAKRYKLEKELYYQRQAVGPLETLCRSLYWAFLNRVCVEDCISTLSNMKTTIPNKEIHEFCDRNIKAIKREFNLQRYATKCEGAML